MVRITHPDHPGLSETIANDARVSARVDHGARNAQLLQDLDAAIHRIALGDAAEIDAHARAREEYRRLLRIEHHVPPVDARQRLVDGFLVGMNSLLEIV